MLSGIWPRGSSSAPASGNTGTISGSSAGPRYSALIGMQYLVSAKRVSAAAARAAALRKQDRRQPLAAFHGGLVGDAPGFEELHELLARAVLVPLAVPLHDLEQLVGGVLPLARGVQ